MIEKNEPLEEVLYNTHPTLPNISEVRQMYSLLYQLENSLMADNRSGPHEDLQTRLVKAMRQMPYSLLQELSIDEFVTYMKLLHKNFKDVLSA